jgi:hypothetical protein
MSNPSFISELEVDDSRIVLATELAQVVHEKSVFSKAGEDEQVQHAMLLMEAVHMVMKGMDFHLDGIHKVTFATFFGTIVDYLCDNAVLEFTEDAEEMMVMTIDILRENLARLQAYKAEE